MQEPEDQFWYFRILRSGNLAVINNFRLTTNPEAENHLLRILKKNGEIVRSFGTAFPPEGEIGMFDNNTAKLDTDNDDNIYVTFLGHNRIEKYSPDGDLMFVSTRPLNYEVDHKIVTLEGYDFTYPEMTSISQDIGVDGKGRIWNLTYKAQPEDKKSNATIIADHTIIDFEIFDENGVLLGSIPTPNHVCNIRIFGDTLYMIDTYTEMCVYEYRIVER